MPSEILVDSEGYTVTDEEGFEVDQSCVARCCGEQPSPCCPSVCGKLFRVCLEDARWVGVETRTYDGTCTDSQGQVQSAAGTEREEQAVTLLASPITLREQDPLSSGCFAQALAPFRDVKETVTNGGPCFVTPRREVLDACQPITGVCAGELTGGTVNTAPKPSEFSQLPITVPGPNFGDAAMINRVFEALNDPAAGSFDFFAVDSGTYTARARYGGNSANSPMVTFTLVLEHAWRFVDLGDGTYRYTLETVLRQTAVPDVPVEFTGSSQRLLGTVEELRVRVEGRYIPVVKCDDTPGPAIACPEPPHGCTGGAGVGAGQGVRPWVPRAGGAAADRECAGVQDDQGGAGPEPEVLGV